MSDATLVGNPCDLSDMPKHTVATVSHAVVYSCEWCHAVVCTSCMA
jgi:hypothetical protein